MHFASTTQFNGKKKILNRINSIKFFGFEYIMKSYVEYFTKTKWTYSLETSFRSAIVASSFSIGNEIIEDFIILL